jgi:hypothetical protein
VLAHALHAHVRAATDGPRLDAPLRRVEDDVLAVPVDPDGRELRGAVAARVVAMVARLVLLKSYDCYSVSGAIAE